MRIACDSCDQEPCDVVRFYGAPAVKRAALQTGDYVFSGFEVRIAIGREELNKLMGRLSQGCDRFDHELSRCRRHELFAVVT